ncbi:MAG TPA: DddA-like double-stranded DNA deaminase toxin [Pseudonocardiaceae bacterium]|jgi:hypothetical protein|nr:DddA-like double-stranded DNA deaminase toxin [Pseudonocardiaceae bacterium]
MWDEADLDQLAGVIQFVHERIGPAVGGARTEGAWIRVDGTVEMLASGSRTPWFAETEMKLIRLGGREMAGALARHIEIQFVVRMSAMGIDHAILALDGPPCGSRPPVSKWQCHRRLPAVIRALCPDATLTVVSPDGQRWEYSEKGRQLV